MNQKTNEQKSVLLMEKKRFLLKVKNILPGRIVTLLQRTAGREMRSITNPFRFLCDVIQLQSKSLLIYQYILYPLINKTNKSIHQLLKKKSNVNKFRLKKVTLRRCCLNGSLLQNK